MAKSNARDVFIAAATKAFGKVDTITRAQIIEVCEAEGLKWPSWFVNDPANRVGRGVYAFCTSASAAKAAIVKPSKKEKGPALKPAASIQSEVPMIDTATQAAMALATVHAHPSSASVLSLVPDKADGYVPFGHFNDVRSIVKSKRFYPVYVTGLSGNGKTMMVEQVCAAEQRECIRVNITIETDEDDLLGGFRLADGKTVWQNGPVVHAMERGAVLLLDEVDLGSNKMMCLQPVLEGKPIFLKKINKLITPAPGFTIIATANTKGKGSDDGRFIGTNVMNEAFLERFSITLEQEYPEAKHEKKILNNLLGKLGTPDAEFVDKLIQWAEATRRTFADGGISELISTRRLVHICEAYAIFNSNREKAVELCLNRFDVDTKNAFLELYKKLDETAAPASVVEPQTGEVPL